MHDFFSIMEMEKSVQELVEYFWKKYPQFQVIKYVIL